MKNILILGHLGQVGWELQRSLSSLGTVIGVDRDSIDITDLNATCQLIKDVKPAVIVNAAAYTAVDKAEEEADLALKINGEVPGVLAEEAKKLGSLLIHYSTDYVFDGTSPRPYLETDDTNPLSSYGRSKLAGELAVAQAGCDYVTLRTSWVYGSRGKNFLLTILRLAQERPNLKIVDDQIGAPTWSRFIADATSQIVAICTHKTPDERKAISGLYHLTSQNHTSWFNFTRQILKEAKTALNFDREVDVQPIASTEFPTPAARPKNSTLNLDKLKQTFQITPPSWDYSLKLCVDELAHRR